MNKKIERNYLEIVSLKDLNEPKINLNRFTLKIIESDDFQLNKFFYKNIGKNHHWVDRLVWTEKNWIEYTSDNKVKTYVLKISNDIAGFFELIFHKDEVKIASLRLLNKYRNKKIGSYLLASAIKNAFLSKPKRVWVHTCSLDHKNALNNYIARGMKIFKKETILA